MKNAVLSSMWLAMFFYAFSVSGQAGTLDPSFGADGAVITDFGGGTAHLASLSLLPDGKIRLGGYYGHKGESKYMVLQYMPDGMPDIAFGSGGMIFTDFSGEVEYRVLPDGKFRLYGFDTDLDSSTFLIQQLLPDGNPDLSFGAQGKVYPGHTWHGVTYPIQRFYLQSDLKIVLVLQGDDFILARLLPDGQPDLSFGNMGIVITDLGQPELCNAVYEQEDGTLLAAGRSGTFYWWTFSGSSVIIRYMPDGTLDTSFGVNGIVLGNLDSIQYGMLVVQEDQKILALSRPTSSVNGFVAPIVMVRYTKEGVIDSSFAIDGKLVLDTTLVVDKIKVLQDGSILLLGSRLIGSTPFGWAQYGLPLVYRYFPDGQPDPGFGYNEYDSTRIAVSDMLIQGDNKLLLCGAYDADAMLFRYLADGQVDNAFGESGMLTLDFGKNGSCWNVLGQADGSFLLAGTKSEITYDSDIILARRLSDTDPDPGFGAIETPGKVIIDFGMDNHVIAEAMAIEPNRDIAVAGSIDKNMVLFQFRPDGTADHEFIEKGYTILADTFEFNYGEYKTLYQEDGKILQAGILQDNGFTKILLLRLNPDGSKDVQFGDAGKVITDFADIEIQWISCISINHKGEIFIAGEIRVDIDENTWTRSPFVVKFLPEGGLDPAFGTNGIALLTEYIDISDAPVIKLFGDGRILLAVDINYELSLIRLLPDGSPDLSFGDNGKISNAFETADQNATALGIQEDNTFIVGGIGHDNRLFFFSCKYLENGMPDPAFGVGGKMTLPVSNAYFFFFNSGADILQQKDGKFIFTGSIGEGDNDLGLIRLDKNGVPDPLFGNQGFIQTDIGGDERLVQATLQDDDRILLAGTSTYNGYSSIVLARYLNDLNLGSIDFSSSMQTALIYPNPVEDQVVLEFELTMEENITIQLIDIQGRLIKTLINNKHMDAGKYKQTLDLRDINSTGYFILQLIGEKGAISVKMIKSE